MIKILFRRIIEQFQLPNFINLACGKMYIKNFFFKTDKEANFNVKPNNGKAQNSSHVKREKMYRIKK